MSEPNVCCNCLHCARWKKKDRVECHCDLTDRYLSYLDVMEENNCEHWEKETKWDLQKEHDRKIIDEFIDVVLNGYSFTEINKEALGFILEDVKKDMLKRRCET